MYSYLYVDCRELNFMHLPNLILCLYFFDDLTQFQYEILKKKKNEFLCKYLLTISEYVKAKKN